MSLDTIGQSTGSPLSPGMMKTLSTLTLTKPPTVASVMARKLSIVVTHLSPAIPMVKLHGAQSSINDLKSITASIRLALGLMTND